ncbi:MAG: FKBP-type peptidyl-prolyl cis-trans isomerase [Micropruina sp.]
MTSLGKTLFTSGLIVVAVAVSGCGSPTSTASPTTSVSVSPSVSTSPSTSPSASAAVSTDLKPISVSGKFGAKPKVTIKAPFAVDKTRFDVLVQGKGHKVGEGAVVKVNYYGSNGRTGKLFQETFSGKQPATFSLDGVVAGFRLGLQNQRVGSRILVAMPGSDGYDAAGGQAEIGVEVGDTLVFVVDIIDGSVSGPTGAAITPKAGLPKVTDSDGKPAIAIPAGDPPASMQVQPLTAGTGAKVAATDIIVVRYLGVSWKTGKVIEDKYAAMDSGPLADTISGWKKGLVGKKVGQRLLLVLPPDEAYPQGSNNPPVEAGDTLVYVIDLLYSSAAA